MHRLYLFEALKINTAQMDGVVLTCPECQKVLNTFQQNMQLVRASLAVPGYTVKMTALAAEAGTKAANEVFGIKHTPKKILRASPAKAAALVSKTDKIMGHLVSRDSPLLLSNLEYCTGLLEQYVMCSGELVHKMFEGSLKAMCVQAWTVLEVLLEDLHRTLVDTHQHRFSADVLTKHLRWKQNAPKGERFGFRTRKAFRNAYDTAFPNSNNVLAAVHNNGIDALAAVRHLIVHKAGIVDTMFLNEEVPKAPLLNHFPCIKLNSELQFDGKIVRAIIDAAIGQGYTLLREVNLWL